jgi:hypothetical protein
MRAYVTLLVSTFAVILAQLAFSRDGILTVYGITIDSSARTAIISPFATPSWIYPVSATTAPAAVSSSAPDSWISSAAPATRSPAPDTPATWISSAAPATGSPAPDTSSATTSRISSVAPSFTSYSPTATEDEDSVDDIEEGRFIIPNSVVNDVVADGFTVFLTGSAIVAGALYQMI